MASIRIYLDFKRVLRDGTAPLRLRICHRGAKSLYTLQLRLKPEEWDVATDKIVDLPELTPPVY